MAGFRRGGGRLLSVVLLLGLLVGGAWNYRRNLEAEEAANRRPYRTLSDTELDQLIAAYRSEVDAWERRRQQLPSEAGGAREASRLDERIRAFERAQESGARRRAVSQELSSRQIALEKLEEEERLRADPGEVLAVHLRRLLSL